MFLSARCPSGNKDVDEGEACYEACEIIFVIHRHSSKQGPRRCRTFETQMYVFACTVAS